MGMYDSFGESDYQLQIFRTPIYYFNKGQYSYSKQFDKPYQFAGTTGGMLNHYPVGASVPWRDACYNYGRNFLVTYVGMDFSVEIYEFCNGKFLKVTELWPRFGEIDWNQFSFVNKHPVYTSYGELLEVIRDVDDLRNYVESVICYYKEINNTNGLFIHSQKLLNKFRVKCCEDEDVDLFAKASSELSEARHKINDTHKQKLLSKFFLKSEHAQRIEKLEKAGIYLELIHREMLGLGSREDQDLYKEALYGETKRYIEENNITQAEYFAWNQPLKRDKKWMQEAFDMI